MFGQPRGVECSVLRTNGYSATLRQHTNYLAILVTRARSRRRPCFNYTITYRLFEGGTLGRYFAGRSHLLRIYGVLRGVRFPFLLHFFTWKKLSEQHCVFLGNVLSSKCIGCASRFLSCFLLSLRHTPRTSESGGSLLTLKVTFPTRLLLFQ